MLDAGHEHYVIQYHFNPTQTAVCHCSGR
jgi:hypothetical protein